MSDKIKIQLETLALEAALYPQESPAELKKDGKALFIGMPKETTVYENRVPLVPGSVALLVNNGHEVWVETGVGANSKFTDREYADAGAKICYSAKEVFQADIVIKVQPPTTAEIGLMKPCSTLISIMQSAKTDKEYFEALIKAKITGVAYSLIEDKVGGRPIVRAMSEIAGSTVMFIASEYLSTTSNGRGIILGGITGVPPSNVVIIGAGTVGEYAARSAMGLGADVRIFDNHIYKLRRLKNSLGHHINTSTLDSITLAEALKDADVVVGALRAEEEATPCVVSDPMVAAMKPGSVIIDVSIDQGGCFATSRVTNHGSPVFLKHDVIHYGVPNIASRVARTASTALSNIFTPIFLQMDKHGGPEGLMFSKEWFLKGVYAYKGCLANAGIAKRFNMKHKDLKLIMAARF